MESALHEDWTEDKIVLRPWILKGKVKFSDIPQLLSERIHLWSSIRPFIRYTGLPNAKEEAYD